MKKMKVLHIWDQAGIASRLANHINTNNLGTSLVIYRAVFDPFNLTGKYPLNIATGGKLSFLYRVIREMIKQPDVVHIHSWDKAIFFARVFARRSKIVMHYHGTDIRGKVIPEHVKRHSSKILVSTRDLLRPGVEHYGYPTE